MEWIDGYKFSLTNKLQSVVRKISSLTLQDDKDLSENAQDIDFFAKKSLYDTIQKALKKTIVTEDQLEKDQEAKDKDNQPIYWTMTSSQYSTISIMFTVEINFRMEYIKFQSYPLRNNQMLSFTAQQINLLSRFIIFCLNPKISLGTMTIDPVTGELTLQAINNSLGHIKRRIKKGYNQLGGLIDVQLKDHQKIWKMALSSFFNMLGIREKIVKKDNFWKIYKDKQNAHQKQKVALLTSYVNQSYIQYPFMFEEIYSAQGVPSTRKIRSAFASVPDKVKKKRAFDIAIRAFTYYQQKFIKDISKILQFFVSPQFIKQENESKIQQISDQQREKLANKLLVDRYQGKFPIYSQLKVDQVRRRQNLHRTSFSDLKLMHIWGRKIQDQQNTLNVIVHKQTQPSRHVNQTQILKLMQKGRSFFITRYYYSKQPEFANSILMEYSPLKSIDFYLTSHKQFVSLSTKLFFLYEIAMGVRFLRDFDIYHNDLKPQNILLKIMGNKIQATFFLRLIDFGQSISKRLPNQLQNRHTYKRGYTIPYAPPQQILQHRYNQKTDVFSLGVMIYEIIFDAFPMEIYRKGKKVYINQNQYLKFLSMAPQKCQQYSLPGYMHVIYELVLRCINPSPQKRPSIDWICLITKELINETSQLSPYQTI